jgi:hypothetical protein
VTCSAPVRYRTDKVRFEASVAQWMKHCLGAVAVEVVRHTNLDSLAPDARTHREAVVIAHTAVNEKSLVLRSPRAQRAIMVSGFRDRMRARYE